LESAGKFNAAVEYYRKAFRLKPELENEEIALQIVQMSKPKIDRNDPRTWSASYWVGSSVVGFLGSNVAVGQQAWKNRLNPNLYKVFSTLMKRKDLWVSVDR
jgi:hypothetical protein